jgi:hypothetical protein
MLAKKLIQNEHKSYQWGRVSIKHGDSPEEASYYFYPRSEYAKRLWDYTPARLLEINPETVIPVKKEEAAREVFPWLWAQDIRAKLDGSIPLDKDEYPQGEVVYPQVAVVPDISERPNVESVNVRNFPDTKYLTGEPVAVLGTIPVGTRINNVLLTGSWGAFRMRDLQGEILDMNDQPVSLDQNFVGAIHYHYLLTTDHSQG